jgi:hypothetical protein
MEQNENKIHTPDDIRKAIRFEFKFLVDLYGYREVPPSPPTHDMYSEVQFEKRKWKIAILNTAHGTQATVQLVSPENERGFLSFLIDSKNAKSIRAKFEANIFGDIQYEAQNLKTYGALLLEGDNKDFEQVLNSLLKKQQRWLVESGIMSESDIAHWKQKQEKNKN